MNVFLGTANGRAALLGLALIFSGSVFLDQVSKFDMHERFLTWEDPEDDDRYLGKKQVLFTLGTANEVRGQPETNFFRLSWHYSRNKGAAFSMLADLPDAWRVPLFHLITIIAVVMISQYLYQTPLHHTFTRPGLVLILAGAMGNFLDRVMRGYVVDFIDTEWSIFGWRHDFAIFNVADVSINVGMICLLIDMLRFRKESKTKPETAAA